MQPLKRNLAITGVVLLFSCVCIVLQAAEVRRDWPADARQMLQENVLKFWIDHAVDHEYGGVLGQLDRGGAPIPPGDMPLARLSSVRSAMCACNSASLARPVYAAIQPACHVGA